MMLAWLSRGASTQEVPIENPGCNAGPATVRRRRQRLLFDGRAYGESAGGDARQSTAAP
jgi:hypothetical protein